MNAVWYSGVSSDSLPYIDHRSNHSRITLVQCPVLQAAVPSMPQLVYLANFETRLLLQPVPWNWSTPPLSVVTFTWYRFVFSWKGMWAHTSEPVDFMEYPYSDSHLVRNVWNPSSTIILCTNTGSKGNNLKYFPTNVLWKRAKWNVSMLEKIPLVAVGKASVGMRTSFISTCISGKLFAILFFSKSVPFVIYGYCFSTVVAMHSLWFVTARAKFKSAINTFYPTQPRTRSTWEAASIMCTVLEATNLEINIKTFSFRTKEGIVNVAYESHCTSITFPAFPVKNKHY